jgi:pimeloyl-ACP methyl ester carboxylesterase
VKTVCLISAVLLLLSMPAAAVSPPAGDRFWVGGAHLGRDWIYVKLKLTHDTGGAADLHVPQLRLAHRKIDGAAISGDRIRLLVDEAGRRVEIEGVVEEKSIRGHLAAEGKVGELRLSPYRPVSPEALDAVAGDYRLSAERTISVVREADGLRLLDFASGDSSLMWPGEEPESFFQVLPLDEAYFNGSRRLGARFDPKAATASFSFRDGTSAEGARVSVYREENVATETTAAHLTGTLKIPREGARFPAIVIVSGSGPNDRTSCDHVQRLFALNGVAVLSYDKRGLGESKLKGAAPDSDHASFAELADDAVAWVDFLKSRPEIDPRRIGLWGHSQGGWIAPIAALKSRDVQFLIIVSAPTVNPLSQTTYYSEHQMRADGFPETDVSDALGYMYGLSAIAASGGRDFAQFKSRRDAVAASPWSEYVATPESAEELLQWPSFDYEPIPTLLKLQIPLLAVYGERDTLIPAVQSALTTRGILRSSGLSSFEVLRFAEGDHELFRVNTGSIREFASRPGYCNGYFSKMLEWVRHQVAERR